MSSFGPSEQQLASEEQSRRASQESILRLDKVKDYTRDELLGVLGDELLKNEKLQAEIKDLREEKVRLSLILEEEDERRANMFLKRVEELEATAKACPKCSIAPAAIMMKPSSSQHNIVVGRSVSMSSLQEHPDDER